MGIETQAMEGHNAAQKVAMETLQKLLDQLPAGTHAMILAVREGHPLVVTTNIDAHRTVPFLDACRESIAASLDRAHAAQVAANPSRKVD